MPEKAPAGQLPRSIDVIADDDLVDVCKVWFKILKKNIPDTDIDSLVDVKCGSSAIFGNDAFTINKSLNSC